MLTDLQDIRNLLADWADEIHDCERIFIRASVSNRRIFLDYEGAVIEKGIFSTDTVVLVGSRQYGRRRKAPRIPLPDATPSTHRLSYCLP